jgi:tetratricopeptide (TPR) repeat protein
MVWIGGGSLPLGRALPLQASPETPVPPDFRAGQQALREGRFDLAAEDFQKVLRLDPNFVEARVNLGLAYHALGKYGEAVRELEAASR